MVDLTEEIVELQTRIQFQDDVIHKLDEVVIRQSRDLERVTRQVKALQDRVDRLAFELEKTATPGDERPPHY